jgi:hypothetical protein
MDLPHHASGERDYIAMRTMTVVRQYLATIFLLVIGLVAYGCGDSATVNPEATLANLTVNTGAADATLDPVFNPATTSYTVNLSNNVTTVTVSAQPAVSGDNVTIDGQATTSTNIDLGQPVPTESTKLVSITVSDPPNNPRTYTVLLRRAALDGNNNLSALSVRAGTTTLSLSEPFNSNTLVYMANVTNNVNEVAVTATRQDANASITVNGQPTNSGVARTITLNPAGQSQSTTTIPIVVTAPNSSQKTYTVNVIRAAPGGSNNLSALTVRLSTSSPNLINFSSNITNYTVNVGSGVSSIRVTPAPEDPAATLAVTSNGPQPITTSGQARTIRLRDAGLSTSINIVVRAPNGSEKPYTITVDRAAPPPPSGNNNLSALTVRLSTSSPNLINFSSNITNYTVNVGSGVSSIRVTPAPEDPAATLAVTSNGPQPITTSGQARTIPLREAGLTTSINVVVRAPNGSEKPYTITVDREAPPPPSGNNSLQSLTVSPGTLSPNFDIARTRTDYAVNDVGSSATTILVTATPQDPSSTVTINGQGPNSRSIPLPTGPSSTEIDILVRAPNDQVKPYLITVIQPAPAAPPAPTSAPDLIREDDTCPPGIPPAECAPDFNGNPTSKEDNITTITRPRFTVAPPAAGETPNLYVDGNIAKQGFDVGANTLTPTIALSEGTHTITSTVTNTATTLESAQSLLSLTVTIDTVAPGP